ncbi:MAG: hypothetical protein JW982_03015 [Spirochaetes bacterium]|nr:hypothetical protein [Spirochaetota bacterium]
MNFNEKLSTLFKNCDFDGALSLLRSVFTDPVNQRPKPKPTDYLDYSEEKKNLGDQFEFTIMNFKLNCSIEEHLDFIVEMLNKSKNDRTDNSNRFQPFNTLVFDMQYSTIVNSLHYDPETNTVLLQYGLNHDAIGEYQMDNFYTDDEAEQVQHFKFCIGEGKYIIRHGDEILDGKTLSNMIDRILIARFLRTEYIPALIAHEGFAKFPKTLPFRFLLTTKYGSIYEEYIAAGDFIEIHPPLTPDIVSDMPLAEVYEKSTEQPAAVYPDDHLLYYISFLHKDRRHLPGFSKLCDIIIGEKNIFEIIQRMSEIFLNRQLYFSGGYVHPEHFLSSHLRTFLATEKGKKILGSHEAIKTYVSELRGFTVLKESSRIIESLPDWEWIAENPEILLSQLQKSEMEMSDDDSELFRKVYSILNQSDISVFPAIFRALGDRDPVHASLAPAFAERFLRIKSPELEEYPEHAIEIAAEYLRSVSSMLALLSSDQRKAVFSTYKDKIDELISHPSAIYRTLAYEAEFVRLEKMHEDEKPGEEEITVCEMQEFRQNYAKSVSDLLLLMPDKFNMYTPLWYFIIPRVDKLGSGEPSVIPRLLSIFENYSVPGGCDRDRVSAIIGTMLIRAGMTEIPSALESTFSQIMREEKEYIEWKRRIPEEKFVLFIKLFESHPETLLDPYAWEEFIHDVLDGVIYFRDQINSHPQKETILKLLFQSAGKGPGPRMVKLLAKAANTYTAASNGKEPFHVIAQNIINCIMNVPEPSVKLIVQAKLVIAAHKIITGEKDAGEYISALASYRNEYPMVAVFETAQEIYTSGIDKAVQLFISRWKEICKADPEYAREFFTFAGSDPEHPEQADIARGYVIFSRAFKEYTEWSELVSHKYNNRHKMLVIDPVKKILTEFSSDSEKNESAGIIDSLLHEYALRKILEKSSREDLLNLTGSCDETSSNIIISHLRPQAASYHDEYFALLDHFKDDLTKYNNCIMKLWPIPQIHEQLLDTLADHPDLAGLPDFIYCYIGGSDNHITGEIFNHLHAANRHDAVIRMAGGLSVHRLIPFIKPVVDSFNASRQYSKAVTWFSKLRTESKPNHPDYVFLTNRIAVFQILNGDIANAENTYTDLFSLDWSAFTGTRSKSDEQSDDIMEEIMGGSLNRELIEQFNSSFASAHYNMACLIGKKGNASGAVNELSLAVSFNRKGYPAEMINQEHDFDSIRESEIFRTYMENLKSQG